MLNYNVFENLKNLYDRHINDYCIYLLGKNKIL